MDIMNKMMEMMGSMSEEEIKKMMEQFFAFMKEKGKGEEKAESEDKTEGKECCPDLSNISDSCSAMMGKFFTEKTSDDRTKDKTGEENKKEGPGRS